MTEQTYVYMKIFYEKQKQGSAQYISKTNLRASTAFKCILLDKFCLIFITHVLDNNFFSPHGTQQQQSTTKYFIYFKNKIKNLICYKATV